MEEEMEVKEEQVEECEEEAQNPNPKPSSVAESIAILQSLNGALSDFVLHYNSLQQTLDSISSTIDSAAPKPSSSSTPTTAIEEEDLSIIIRTKSIKPFRRYIFAHIADIDRLRKEIPEALKLSLDPASLVLESIGKFYLRGSKAYERGDAQAIKVRRISILLLEFYLLAGCPVVEGLAAEVKERGRVAAVAWMDRLRGEGKVASADPVDALGLVLLIASFGVPPEFKNMDLYELIRLSNLKKKGDVLWRSEILNQKMPEIIKDLIRKEMFVEAVELVCAFGLEEKFAPLPLLSAFVEKTCAVGSEERKEGHCSVRSLKEANEKQLAALKSVVKCLEDYKLDATELSSHKITQKIAGYEREIIKWEKKLRERNAKRKPEDFDSLYNQAKQIRPFPAKGSNASPLLSIRQTQEQGITPISDSRYPYNGYIASNMHVSSEASHGGWNGGPASYQNLAGQGLLGTPYSSGHDFARYPIAVAGKNMYQPSDAEQNYYQPPAAGQNSYRTPAAVLNFYQPAAAEQNYYQAPAASLVNGGRNLFQFADTVSERESLPGNYTTSSSLPAAGTATNPSH